MKSLLRQFLHTWRRRRASRLDWRRRHGKVFALHPELRKPRDKAAERAHLALWRPLRGDISLATYRVCANLSGVDDPRFVPEEVFVSELQDFLYPNPHVRFLADKNVYDRWFGRRLAAQVSVNGCQLSGARSLESEARDPGSEVGDPGSGVRRPVSGVLNQQPATSNGERTSTPAPGPRNPERFPRTFLRKMDGRLFDAAYREVSDEQLSERLASLPYPVVCKPSKDSFGGRNISFCHDPEAVRNALAASRHAIVQERIRPHAFFARFSPVGLNTLRVYCYRSPGRETWQVLNAALRMGVGGSLDNETAGGIVCYIDADGGLNAYALDKYAGSYDRHPDRGIVFAGLWIPQNQAMHDVALSLASQIPGTRLVGLDLCLDDAGRWRCVEINLGMQTIRFAQYAGHPFFGAFTDETLRFMQRDKAGKNEDEPRTTRTTRK